MNKERAKNLYNLLMKEPNHWFSQWEICMSVKGYKYHDRKNDNCPTIREDKNYINESEDFEKIVVMKDYKFKIANKEEYKIERNAHIRRLKEQVKIIKDMDFKYDKNNTLDLTTEEFIESVLKENK